MRRTFFPVPRMRLSPEASLTSLRRTSPTMRLTASGPLPFPPLGVEMSKVHYAASGSVPTELVERLVSDVERHSYMGPYRKGIVAGIRCAGQFASARCPYENPRTIRTWLAGAAVGRARIEAAILKATPAQPGGAGVAVVAARDWIALAEGGACVDPWEGLSLLRAALDEAAQ